jgi:hypothetical protein
MNANAKFVINNYHATQASVSAIGSPYYSLNVDVLLFLDISTSECRRAKHGIASLTNTKSDSNH